MLFHEVKGSYSISFMTLHQLRVFITVAKLGSFTQAARSLHIVQPAVSNDVKALEKELGIKFFQRFGNKFRLTTAGEMLLREAEEVVARADGLKDKVDEIKGLKKGKISVGGSAIAAATFLPEIVQRFKKEYPGVNITFIMQGSDDLEKKLLAGELDVAITGRAPQSSLIIAEPYHDEEVVTIASPSHPLSRKRLVSLELLAKEPLITTPKGYAIREMVERRFAEKGFLFAVALEVEVQAGIRDAVKSAVASSLGIGFVSKSAVLSDIKAGRLKALRVPDLKLKKTQYIAIHKNRPNSPLVLAFIELLKNYKE